jgi:predicted enzyme related to lactoylglutathione lyase
VFEKGDRAVGGLMKITQEGQPPSWTTYIDVDDADGTIEKIKEGGGDVMVEPMDVSDYGRMAVVSDPTGAVFGLWQPGTNKGSGVIGEPGSIAWHQVSTRDPEKALGFYEAVFGWQSERVDTGGADYWELSLDEGATVGGLFRMGDDFPDDVPAHWIVYFAVEDVDGSVRQAEEGGATVRAPAIDTEAGRFAVLQDPDGAAFALIDQSSRADGDDTAELSSSSSAGRRAGRARRSPRRSGPARRCRSGADGRSWSPRPAPSRATGPSSLRSAGWRTSP